MSPLNTGGRRGCVLAAPFLDTCKCEVGSALGRDRTLACIFVARRANHYAKVILGRVVNTTRCGAYDDNHSVTNLVFAIDAVILAESLEVLMMARVDRPFELQPGLLVVLHETLQILQVCAKDVKTLENFIFLGSVVHNNDESLRAVFRWIALTYTAIWTRSAQVNNGDLITCAACQRFE